VVSDVLLNVTTAPSGTRIDTVESVVVHHVAGLPCATVNTPERVAATCERNATSTWKSPYDSIVGLGSAMSSVIGVVRPDTIAFATAFGFGSATSTPEATHDTTIG
jgi:hypothetical protein